MTLSAKERIKRAGPTTKTVWIWLGADLDLLDEYEATELELAEAQKPSDSLAGNGPVGDIKARHDALRAQLDEYRMGFRLRGLDDGRWRRLVEAHPARRVDNEVHPHDRIGWDASTFPAALVRAATVSPDLDDEDWEALLGPDAEARKRLEEQGLPVPEGILTSTQLDELSAAAFKLSRHEVDIPFSPAVSPLSPSFERE